MERKGGKGDRNNKKNTFYNLKILLGEKALRKIEKVKIAFVGVGGIGSNFALNCAALGFKKFVLIDSDSVEKRNIPLSTAFRLMDVGKPKVEALEKFLYEKYEDLEIESYPKFVQEVSVRILEEPDMVVLGVDNNLTRLYVTYQRMQANKPLICLGFWEYEASFLLTIPGKTACWGCLFRPKSIEETLRLAKRRECPDPEKDLNIPSRILPAVSQKLVSTASIELLKYFLGIGKPIHFYSFNSKFGFEDMYFLESSRRLRPDPECPLCQKEEWLEAKD